MLTDMTCAVHVPNGSLNNVRSQLDACTNHLFIAYVECCGMVASDMFFPERQMSADRNHFHGMANHPPHGMAMKSASDESVFVRDQKPESRTGR